MPARKLAVVAKANMPTTTKVASSTHVRKLRSVMSSLAYNVGITQALAFSNMPPADLFTSGGRGWKVANNNKNSNSQQKRRSSRGVCLWPLGHRLLRRVCFRVLLHEHIDLSNSSSKQAATVAAGGSTHLKQNPVTRRLRKPKSGNIWMMKDSQNVIRMEAQ